MKKYTTITNVIFFVWGLVLIAISQFYREYTRYFLYLSLVVIIPVMIFNLIKQKREDKLNDTKKFQSSIFRMLIMALLLVIVFLATRQNDIY
jgi:4-hydroxybenzoate polyprenyltransferase